MLEINKLSIEYKTKKEVTPVIENLSLTIKKGEAIAILGPSGCGKSTLINALGGNVNITSGTIEFEREKKQLLNPKIHKIGLIPQNCGLLPWKTIEKNCLLPLKIRGECIDGNRRQEINKIYKALGIMHLLKKYPSQISGGQLQRAAVARAFILQPDVLLMDEPFSALDEINREEAIELFLDVWKQNKPTTILVTHSISEALYLGNQIIVMKSEKGSIVYEKDNPYFGKQNPSSIEYLKTKELLRKKLTPIRQVENDNYKEVEEW